MGHCPDSVDSKFDRASSGSEEGYDVRDMDERRSDLLIVRCAGRQAHALVSSLTPYIMVGVAEIDLSVVENRGKLSTGSQARNMGSRWSELKDWNDRM